ncbi:MAG: sporulation protein YtfJ [Clostridiales bacterium]|nr:sporulation protein YtfJ [Clostridiales bacterium]
MNTLLPEKTSEHPIESIMDSTFGKMRSLTDTDTIVGQPIVMPDGTTVIPVSKISVGIVTGGGEYGQKSNNYPFAGASGAGMSVAPICFLICDGRTVRMLNVGDNKNTFDKIVETVPGILGSIFGRRK